MSKIALVFMRIRSQFKFVCIGRRLLIIPLLGASTDSCSQTYRGPEAFSEVEARNVRDYVLSLNGAVKYYQTLHSYSQLVLIPWGYTSDLAPGKLTPKIF